MAKRATHCSGSGKKLYAVRDSSPVSETAIAIRRDASLSMLSGIKVIRFSDLVRANPHGPASLELGKQLLRDIAQAGARLEDFQCWSTRGA